jgi:hypothetical protein
VVVRLQASLQRQREEERRPAATRALGFLLAGIAEGVSFGHPRWHRNRFAFRAFRLALGRLLEALEPAGEMTLPSMYKKLETAAEQLAELGTPLITEDMIVAFTTSPEALAEYLAKGALETLLHPRPGLEATLRALIDRPRTGPIMEMLLDDVYGAANAARDLGIRPVGRR